MAASRHDRAMAVALEHIRWAQAAGLSPGVIIAGLGGASRGDSSWDDAFAFVARRWFELDLAGLRHAA
jgi:hypothetical protein